MGEKGCAWHHDVVLAAGFLIHKRGWSEKISLFFFGSLHTLF